LFMRSARFDAAPATLEAAVVGAGTLSVSAALAVYRRMYWHRLVQAHWDLFEHSGAYLGERVFTQLVCACMAAQPSRVHALEQLAAPFAAYAAVSLDDVVGRQLINYEAAWLAALTSPDEELVPVRSTDLADATAFTRNVVVHRSLRLAQMSTKSADILRLSSSEVGDQLPQVADVAGHDESRYFAIIRPQHHVRVARLSGAEYALLSSTRPFVLGQCLTMYADSQWLPAQIYTRIATLLDYGMFCWHGEETERK
jgi:Putative DNA-binding domain